MGSSRRRRRGATGTSVLLRLSSATVLALAMACSRTPGDPVERATRSISADHIQNHGRTLASDAMAGRYHASPEVDSAAAFILRRLHEVGARSVERADDLLGARPASFAHYFSVSLYRIGRRTRLAVLRGSHGGLARVGVDYVPLVWSRDQEVLGEVTHLGSAAELLTDRAADSLRARVVAVPVESLSLRADEPIDAALYRAARRLTELGAAAVLFTGVEDWLRLPGAAYPSFLAPEFQQAAQSPRGIRLNLNPDRLSIALQARAWRLAAQRTCPALVVRPGWSHWLQPESEVSVRTELVPEVSLGQNILAGFGGSGAAHELVLLTAHYDNAGINALGEILNGADDNASGVAALLEIARALAQVHERLQRSVLLAFVSAELHGVQGSEMLLKDLPLLVGTARPLVAFSLDAVGRNGSDVLNVAGGLQHADLVRRLERFNRRETLFAPALLVEPLSDPMRASETSALLDISPHPTTHALLLSSGIRSVRLHDGLDPLLYGQPEDDWRRVDAKKVARVARLLFRTVYDLATDRRPAALPAGSHP
ncbi:MAG: M28 family metallopeptidase [Candidatus Krumholzibacteriia bacterium]